MPGSSPHAGGSSKSSAIQDAKADFDLDPVAVEAGETIDFVVDIGGRAKQRPVRLGPNNPKLSRAADSGSGSRQTWDAARDFAGPPSP